jgi:hypothetical protein
MHDVATRYANKSQEEILDRVPEIPREHFGPGTLLILVTDVAGVSWFRLPLNE